MAGLIRMIWLVAIAVGEARLGDDGMRLVSTLSNNHFFIPLDV